MAGERRWVVVEGDCLETMRGMPAGSVDAVVCDPPAGIAFMGKAWDGDKGGRKQWIAWLAEIMAEALRVLKPGGHALVWALPRTSHWTGTALEDAGFEVRDCLQHHFGCLTPEAEILIDGRWERYHKGLKGRRALCCSADNGRFEWQEIQETIEYENEDPCFRIHGDHTDHTVTGSHRVLVERGGNLLFVRADACEREEAIPVLEDLPSLLAALPVPDERAGDKKEDMHPGVRGSPVVCGENRGVQESAGHLRSVRGEVPAEDTQGNATFLRAGVLREEQIGGPEDTGATTRDRHAWAGRVDGQEPRELPAENVWPEQPGMEGRGNVLPKEGIPRPDQIRSLSAGPDGHGAERRLRDGAPPDRGDGAGPSAYQVGGGAPRRPRPDEQRNREPVPVRVKQRSQAVRASRHAVAHVARVERVDYRGPVWCVRVPFGAFVARQNGKVFITGNSGFPKSLDVSKAIDQHARGDMVRKKLLHFAADRGINGKWLEAHGVASAASFLDWTTGGHVPGEKNWALVKAALGVTEGEEAQFEREVVGRSSNQVGVGWAAEGQAGYEAEFDLTTPATEAAKQWDGWGTALKPSTEFYWLARKPLTGTVAANVLEHGTGALNIDANRVESGPDHAEKCASVVGLDSNRNGAAYGDWPGDRTDSHHAAGRWPPHLLLTHGADCGDECEPGCPVRVIGDQSGEGKDGTAVRRRSGGDTFGGDKPKPAMDDLGYGAGGTAARFFPTFHYVAKPSTAEKEAGVTREPSTGGEATGRTDGSAGLDSPRAGAGRIGGRRNIHPTTKPISLFRWLTRLITPPGGVILDPFAGSGTTGCAAMLEGFRFIGCELESVHVEIANDRIGWWEQVDPDAVTTDDYTTRTPRPNAVDERQGTMFEGES